MISTMRFMATGLAVPVYAVKVSIWDEKREQEYQAQYRLDQNRNKEVARKEHDTSEYEYNMDRSIQKYILPQYGVPQSNPSDPNVQNGYRYGLGQSNATDVERQNVAAQSDPSKKTLDLPFSQYSPLSDLLSNNNPGGDAQVLQSQYRPSRVHVHNPNLLRQRPESHYASVPAQHVPRHVAQQDVLHHISPDLVADKLVSSILEARTEKALDEIRAIMMDLVALVDAQKNKVTPCGAGKLKPNDFQEFVQIFCQTCCGSTMKEPQCRINKLAEPNAARNYPANYGVYYKSSKYKNGKLSSKRGTWSCNDAPRRNGDGTFIQGIHPPKLSCGGSCASVFR